MITLKIAVNFTDEVLGTANANPEIHKDFIASHAPDAPKMDEEVEAIGADGVFEKGMTVFPRDDKGNPFVWDYQWKGFFKDAFGALKKVPGSKCGTIKAYKKDIDGLVFINPRKIAIEMAGPMGICQRPLRAQTMQGERVALASSEAVPAGSKMVFDITLLYDGHEAAIMEALDYGKLRGFGQWRNSGKGRFTFELLERKTQE